MAERYIPTDAVSVSRLNLFVDKLLHSNALLHNLHVRGELSNVKLAAAGHLYFTLGEAGADGLVASIPGIMFAEYVRRLDHVPEDGESVILTASMTMYEKTGRVQLQTTEMYFTGSGDGREAFEALKRKLLKEGLFAEERKRPLPRFPRRVGIVTSPIGAAISDIVRTCRQRLAGAELVLAPASVQGERAPESIAAAIALMNREPDVDVMIVGRGGGSAEDLAAFNTETVVRAVATSRIPIISAVGHETDFSLCDFAADARAATPTAAAVLAYPVRKDDIKRQLEDYYARLRKGLSHTADMYEERLNRLAERLTPEALMRLTEPKEARLTYLETRLKAAMQATAEREAARLDRYEAALKLTGTRLTAAVDKQLRDDELRFVRAASALEAVSPLLPLTHGFGYITDEHDRVVSSAADLTIDEKVRVVLYDGSFTAKVDTIEYKTGKGDKNG